MCTAQAEGAGGGVVMCARRVRFPSRQCGCSRSCLVWPHLLSLSRIGRKSLRLLKSDGMSAAGFVLCMLLFNPVMGTVAGSMVFTAANGDRLSGVVAGGFSSPTTAVGTYTFTRGTGRFENATGSAGFSVVTPDGVQFAVGVCREPLIRGHQQEVTIECYKVLLGSFPCLPLRS